MDPRPTNPDAHGRWAEELPELLRAAVGELRDAPVPADVCTRALERARQISPTPPVQPRPRLWPTSRLSLLLTGAIAAGLLSYLCWHSDSPVFVHEHRQEVRPPHSERTQVARVGRVASPSAVHVLGQGRVVLHGRGGEPGLDVTPVTLGHFAGNWSEWERARALRDLSRRSRVKAYLPYAPGGTGKRLPQGRVVCGGNQELKLVGVQVQVVIEGPRVRTLVDHVFSNNTGEVQAGTFEYSLPPGERPSYFAVFPGSSGPTKEKKGPPEQVPPLRLPAPERYVQKVSTSCWGEPRRAAVVATPKEESDQETATHDEAITDCFRGPMGRVRPGSLVRVVIASEGPLTVRGGRAAFRYALPECKVNELSYSLQVDAGLAKHVTHEPDGAKATRSEGKVVYSRRWKDAAGGGEVRLEATLSDPTVEVCSGRQASVGPRYAFVRVRPEFPAAEKKEPPFAEQAIFLLDTSAAEDPKRHALSVRLLESILEKDGDLKRFNVLTFSTGPAWLGAGGWLANTREVRDAVLPRLESAALEGATDVSAALDAVARPEWGVADDQPVNVFLLSDGRPSWGEADVAALAARFEARCRYPVRWHCYRTGLGAENEELFAALTRRGGGTHRLTGPDDLAAASLAHRQRCLQIERVAFEGGPQASEVLVAGRRAALPPGGELLIAARFAEAGKTSLVVEGSLGGKKVVSRHELEVGDGGELAPRAWAEVAVESLLAVNDPSLEPLAVTIGRQFRIASRVTSFAHVQDDPDEDADATDVTAELAAAWRKRAEEPAGRERVRAMLWEALPQKSARRDVALLWKLVRDEDLVWPTARVTGTLTARKALPAEYLAAREAGPLLDEADRRAKEKDQQGAIRALSGWLERSPDRTEAVRLVTYHLIATGEAEAAAALLLEQVRRRPQNAAIHRALGLSLSVAGRHAWAALHYETALALLADRGDWFRAVRSEYGDVLALAAKAERSGELRDHYRTRQRELEGRADADVLRVAVTWSTETAVVELELTDGNGKPVGSAGARLTGDREGPRTHQTPATRDGSYVVAARLSSSLTAETCAVVAVRRGQQRERKIILLRRAGERVKVAEVRPAE